MKSLTAVCVFLCALTAAFAAAPADPPDGLQLADGLYSRGMYDMAVKEYQSYLTHFPDTAKGDVVHFRMAESYWHLGRTNAADIAYEQVATQYPKSPYGFKAGLRRAELAREAGKYDAAVALLAKMLQQKPPADTAAACEYLTGDSLLKNGKPDDAARAFQTVISEYASSEFYSYAALALGGIYSRKDAANAQVADLYELAAAKPASPRIGAEALFQLGDFYFRQKAFDKSSQAYEKLLGTYPEDSRAAEARYEATWAFHNAGMYANALRRCVEMMTSLPSLPLEQQAEWLYLKANCERQLVKNEAAVQTYSTLLSKYPASRVAAAAAYERAVAYYGMGKYADAAREAAALKQPSDSKKDVLWLLAESYAAMKQDNDAIQYYKMLVEQFPADARACDAAYRMGHLLQARGDFAQAAEQFGANARNFPASELAPQSLFASAYCLTKLQKNEEAVRDWTALIQKYPQSPLVEESLYQKGVAEIALHRDAQAMESLRGLLTRYPKTKFAADAHYWTGLLLQQAGKLDDAETELRAALAAKPAQDLLRNAQLRLALILQKSGKEEEAAGLLQDLLASPVRASLAPELLKWLSEYQLDRKRYAAAAEAALLLCENGGDATWRQVGWCLAGRARLGEGKAAEAQSAFAKALAEKATTPAGAEAALRLGELALGATNYPAAQDYMSQAADRATDDNSLAIRAQAYAGLGRIAKGQGRVDEAARYFMSVAVLFDDPNLVPECLHEAADAFASLGRNEDRDKALKELRQRYPQSKWAK